jgi:predicted kinase
VAVEIRAESDDAVANGRLAQRTVVPGGSEAGVDTRCEMRRHFDPWPQATAVSTDTGVERSLAGTVSAVNAAARGAQR